MKKYDMLELLEKDKEKQLHEALLEAIREKEYARGFWVGVFAGLGTLLLFILIMKVIMW